MKYKGIFLVMLMIFSLSYSFAASDVSDISLVQLSLINQDPTTAVAGEITEINVGFENLGGKSAENIILEIEPEYPFKMISDSIINVGTIYGYQYDSYSKIKNFKILVDKDTTEGTYELKLKYYENNSNVVSIEYIDIDVVGRTSAQIISLNETQLELGKIVPIKFTINNVGSTALKNVNFEWTDSEGVILPIGTDNNRYISYLDIQDSQDFEFDVVTGSESSSGLYKLDLKLTYENPITNEEETFSTKMGIYVGGDADFEVLVSDISSDDYSFSIMNVGTTPAYSISMKILNENGWSVDGVNTIILGNLDSADYTSTSLTLIKNGLNSGNIEMELSYTNSNGARKIITKEIIFETSNDTINRTQGTDTEDMRAQMMANGNFQGRNNMQTSQNTSLLSQYKYYLIILVVVIGLFYGYSIYKKKKISKMMR